VIGSIGRELGESSFVAHDARFAAVLGHEPTLELVVATDAHEGPVYVADEDALYFTSRPREIRDPAPGHRESSIKRVSLDGDSFPMEPGAVFVVSARANNANGMCLARDGALIVCEQGSRSEHAAIARVDRRTGASEVVVEEWRGLRLSSPNDVVVKSDGSVWFTDPSYGHLQGFRPEPQVGDYVYRHDPTTGRTSVVADSFVKPNGLAFSPDEDVLYITDSGANQEAGSYYIGLPHHILAFDVRDGSHLTSARLFAVTTPGFPDGIKVDMDGRVYASSFSGVQVFDPTGDLIGEIHLPGAVNFTFGGPDRNVLFITTDDAICAARLAAQGIPPAPDLTQGV